jgi:hypothetical protein
MPVGDDYYLFVGKKNAEFFDQRPQATVEPVLVCCHPDRQIEPGTLLKKPPAEKSRYRPCQGVFNPAGPVYGLTETTRL